MKKTNSNSEQVRELLYQALETELGGVQVYKMAIECAVNPDLKKEWQEYLEETEEHHQILFKVLEKLGCDPNTMTPGREIVNSLARSYLKAMEKAKASGNAAAAELVAAECVVLAETKDHLNWELMGQLAKQTRGEEAKILQEAFDEVYTDETHHLFHTKGWTRELWIQSLGLPAVLPPPEEVKHVETAIGASRAEQAREKML